MGDQYFPRPVRLKIKTMGLYRDHLVTFHLFFIENFPKFANISTNSRTKSKLLHGFNPEALFLDVSMEWHDQQTAV